MVPGIGIQVNQFLAFFWKLCTHFSKVDEGLLPHHFFLKPFSYQKGFRQFTKNVIFSEITVTPVDPTIPAEAYRAPSTRFSFPAALCLVLQKVFLVCM